jgi:3'-5' exoribonuclease
MNNKGIYIKDIKENIRLEGLFLVKDKNNGITKNGKPYLALNISDKTGDVKGRIWDNAEKFGKLFSQGDIVKLRAFSVLYQGILQLNINAIEKYNGDDSILCEFLPASENDPEKCFNDLMSFVDKIDNIHIKKLLDSVFADKKIATAFKSAPAAKTIHHDYLGGLLEHTLSVTQLAYDISKHYRNINRDILLAGSILHDIGKIHELSYDRNFEYSDAGRLVGHIVLGYEIVTEKIKLLPDFPEDLARLLRHLILSHHGQYDFGSPKRPKTLEALLLSYLDDIDAKMYGLAQFIKKEKKPDTKWTSYHKLFDRYIYTDTFKEDETDGNRLSEKDPVL